MSRIGAIFTPFFPPERLRDAAMAAEREGIAQLWVWEDCFREGSISAAAAILAWTERLAVGIGVAPMPLRNSALLAMELATLERMFPGRLVPGVGHGVLDWMGQVGARVASPLTLMREYVPALRGLLAGEQLDVAGRYVTLDGVRLDWPPFAAPPVLAAAEGPKTLRLSGEVADGTIIPSGWTPSRLRTAVQTVQEARDASGRPGGHEIVVFVTAGFGGAGTLERVRADHVAWKEELDPSFDIAGTPEDVVAGIVPFFDAGATSVILQPTMDEPDLYAFLAGVGEVSRVIG
ncbi:LLM class flavin-dependent oxidoreductase [Microbacterium sp. CJ88]|uniref:LLM class flavin-dependent oxidoreductase n=1 Tax=Microbacterium sp. CJ88 TaxID=3445672 RepID=UPI003F65B670